MGTPQDPPYPSPGPPIPLPDPDAPPDPDEDEPPPVPLPSLIARDPRTDPQPGDVLSRDGTSRRVIKRDGERVFVSGGMPRYWMRMNRWRKWCAQGDAKR